MSKSSYTLTFIQREDGNVSSLDDKPLESYEQVKQNYDRCVDIIKEVFAIYNENPATFPKPLTLRVELNEGDDKWPVHWYESDGTTIDQD